MGAVVFVDTMFYAAIAPLLPALSHALRLSKLSAGVLTASYPIGTLVGSVPGGVLAARAGPKLTVYTGLALLAASTLAFGFLHSRRSRWTSPASSRAWAGRARGPAAWPGSSPSRRPSAAER